MTDLLDERARRPHGRGRPALERRRRPRRGRAGARRPPRPAGTSPPRSPTCPGPTRPPPRRRPTRRPGTRWCSQAIEDPTGFVDQQALEVARLAPAALLARWGTARTALAAALRGLPAGQKMPWFGPPMSPTSMATARFMETWAHSLDVHDGARGRAPSSPTGSGTSPTSASAPATSPSACTGCEPPAEEFRVELTAPSGELWTWGPRTPPQTVHRLGVRLLPAGHPAACTATTPTWSPPARTPSGGSTSPRPSPARPGAGTGGRVTERAPDRQLLRLLRRPALRDARDARGSRRAGLDVLTGDYLAELTMLILGKDPLKDPSLGYARTFVRQVEDCLGLALERGVRIVANAGGLNPAGSPTGCARSRRASASTPTIAHVEGDDLRPRATELGCEGALTANAYLGGFGIAAALRPGADIVVTGRVTDASLVVGPAVAHFGWTPDVVRRAGRRRGRRPRPRVRDPGHRRQLLRLPRACRATRRPLGFPLAEIAADGSCVITKHDGTGGAVTVDTVTAQLVYEIQSTHYLGPDVTTRPRHRSQLEQDGPRPGARSPASAGSAPPERLKVCVNELGGFRNPSSSCSPASTSRRRPTGCASSSTPALTRRVGHLDPRPRCRPPTPTPRRARRACCGAR